MPGVPSGKGCDACRKQKKKCDLSKPSCSRCARLRIPCVGAGQQRYKFKDQSRPVKRMNSDSSTEQKSSHSATPDPSVIEDVRALSRSPSNDTSALAAALVHAVSVETSWRFNIAYAYGGFVALIPQRLGRNAALDASVSALTEAHSMFCNAQLPSRSVLSKYSHALTQLRLCLSDPQVATQSETLASVMLLLITQSFIGTGGTRPAASHVVGMAKLLKVRGTQHDPNDPFESLLLLTLRGPVVFEGLWNEQIQFTESQWKELVENHWDNDRRPEGILMRCMAKIPTYILRGRQVLRGETIDPTLAQEVSTVYHQLLQTQKNVRTRIEDLKRRIPFSGPQAGMLNEICDATTRIYTFLLAIVILAGCVLGAIAGFTLELQGVLNSCASEVISYVPWAQKYRPLGASYMLLSLSMAWAGTNDPALKAKLQEAYIDQSYDFPGDRDIDSIIESLDLGAKKFMRLGVDSTCYQSNKDRLEQAMQVHVRTSDDGRENTVEAAQECGLVSQFREL